MKVKLTIGNEGISISDAITLLANINGGEVNRQVDITLLNSAIEATQKVGSTTIGEVEDDNTTSHADVTGQLDKDGLPWDERIHSSNKKMTAKGIWTRRRGISDLQFDQIAAELKAGATAPVQHPVQPAAPAPAPYTPPAAAPQQFQQFAAPAPIQPQPFPQAPQGLPHIPMQIAPIAPVDNGVYAAAPQQFQPPAPVQPVAPQPAPQGQYQITDLFNKIQPMFAANVEQAQGYVNSLTQRLSTQFQMQVQSVNDIAGRPDMIAYAMQLIAADGK